VARETDLRQLILVVEDVFLGWVVELVLVFAIPFSSFSGKVLIYYGTLIRFCLGSVAIWSVFPSYLVILSGCLLFLSGRYYSRLFSCFPISFH
jgi:hypothetical protein